MQQPASNVPRFGLVVALVCWFHPLPVLSAEAVVDAPVTIVDAIWMVSGPDFDRVAKYFRQRRATQSSREQEVILPGNLVPANYPAQPGATVYVVSRGKAGRDIVRHVVIWDSEIDNGLYLTPILVRHGRLQSSDALVVPPRSRHPVIRVLGRRSISDEETQALVDALVTSGYLHDGTPPSGYLFKGDESYSFSAAGGRIVVATCDEFWAAALDGRVVEFVELGSKHQCRLGHLIGVDGDTYLTYFCCVPDSDNCSGIVARHLGSVAEPR